LKLTQCEKSAQKCTTEGAEEGHIETRVLEGVLGFIGSATPGLDLFPLGKAGAFMEFTCAGTAGSVRGGVIVPVPKNAMRLSTSLSYAQRKGQQKPESFASQPKSILEVSFGPSPFEHMGLTMKLTQTNLERVETNSVV
jgi:hypothetical protein